MSSHIQTLERYYTIIGRIPYPYNERLEDCDISDPSTERFLEFCNWEDYHKKDSYNNCVAKDSVYYSSRGKKYDLDNLKNAILNFIEYDSEQYRWHIEMMKQNYIHMKTDKLSIEEKQACALVLSYYTGYKNNSDRLNRNMNVISRGLNEYSTKNNWSDGEKYFPLIYFMSKALENLPLYWGYTVRCIDMEENILNDYQPGTVITWFGYSSSKIGEKPAPDFQSRNTWFFIYSFSSREISQFSAYSLEKEALYPPFSHFLVIKKEIVDDKTKIYMRQIEIGLYINNIIWVDDNIFNADMEDKSLMEKAYAIRRDIKIIPKISTECAKAFFESFKPYIKDKTVKYKIMSDMTRKNEKKSHNAGARLIKYLQENGFSDIEVMIFTSSYDNAMHELQELKIDLNKFINITTDSGEALNFLISD